MALYLVFLANDHDHARQYFRHLSQNDKGNRIIIMPIIIMIGMIINVLVGFILRVRTMRVHIQIEVFESLYEF